MSKLTNQWIDAFASGKHRDSEDEFTDADLDQMVANYNPAHHEAPVVVGHPVANGPAYGWVDKVRRLGNVLQVKLKQVVPEFEEAVEAGRFKKRSVSLYKTPTGWSLRHVGFLGAQPPQVKGLQDIQFEQEDKDSIEIEYQEEVMAMDEKDKQSIVDLVSEKIKSFFPGTKPAETATYTEEQRKADLAAAVAAALKPIEDKLALQQTQFSEKETAAQVSERKARAVAAVTKLKAAGKWVPAFDKLGLPYVFEELAKADATVEFGEGDGKKTQTPLEIFLAYMETLPKIVPSERFVEASEAGSGAVRTYSESADQNSVKLTQATEALMAKDSTLTFAEAGRRAVKEHPELIFSAGRSTSGSV